MNREHNLGDYAETDAFFDALARGEDPSAGSDDVAGLLLALKDDVERPMPEPPSIELGDASRARMNPWAAGLIGAAAASAAIIGTGAMLYEPAPGGHDDTTMIELATTLDELEVARESGDDEAARGLIEQARGLVASMKNAPRDAGATATKTVISTVKVTEKASTPPDVSPVQPAQPAQPSEQVRESAVPQVSQESVQPALSAPSAMPSQSANTAAAATPASSATPAPEAPAPAPQPEVPMVVEELTPPSDLGSSN